MLAALKPLSSVGQAMSRPRFFVLFAVVAVVACVWIGGAAPAVAQSNYPANATIEVRDENGNLVSASVGVEVGDPLSIFSTGWQANSDVQLEFFSDPINLGTARSDANGVVRATVRVPNVTPGVHTLRLTGIGADGRPRVAELPVRVVAASPGGGATSDRTGGVARTGASNVAEIAGAGFALVVVGAVLALAVRRNRAAHTPA